MQDRDRCEQRRPRDVAPSIVRRVPTREAIAPPQKPSTPDRHDLGDDHPVIRCGDPVVRRTNHGRASQVICVPSEEITSAARSAEIRRSRRRLTTRPRRRTRRRSSRAAAIAAAKLVEQLLEALAQLFELERRQLERRGRGLRGAAPARRELMLVAQRVAQPLLVAGDELVAQHDRLEPVGGELDPRRRGAPGTLAPDAALSLGDEAPLRERAQVVAARRGAVADDRRALRRGRLLDRVQVVEQRKPGRVGERAHRARVIEGERVLERDLSKLLFREPCVKYVLFLGRVEPGGRLARGSPLRTQASVSRTVSSSGRC